MGSSSLLVRERGLRSLNHRFLLPRELTRGFRQVEQEARGDMKSLSHLAVEMAFGGVGRFARHVHGRYSRDGMELVGQPIGQGIEGEEAVLAARPRDEDEG